VPHSQVQNFSKVASLHKAEHAFSDRLSVNGDAAESFRVQSVVKEELVHSMEEILAIYLHLRQTLIGRSAAAAVIIDVLYPHSDLSVVW
jgi:hypothetical protein